MVTTKTILENNHLFLQRHTSCRVFLQAVKMLFKMIMKIAVRMMGLLLC
jgi:hypothetical protein